MSFPVTLDEAAIARVKHLLTKDGRPELFLRVGVKGGGCSGFEYLMKLDSVARENDLVAELESFTVRCDPKSATFLEGTILRYTGNLIGGGFQFDNPNAARSCGCGTSFTPKSS
jgi:iron-sulfur cluster assembly protein